MFATLDGAIVQAVTATLDHLIVGAATLAQGAAYIQENLGVPTQTGGRHIAMGTHNCVLRLGARVYLEVIAIDPEGSAPARPRWFGLDDAATRERLSERPRLLTWAARTTDIDAAVNASPITMGTVHPMARGAYTWRITIPDDGTVVCEGLMPTLIQWDGDAHPADNLAERGCALTRLQGRHPAPATLQEALERLGLTASLAVTRGPRSELSATLRGPRGLWTLTS